MTFSKYTGQLFIFVNTDCYAYRHLLGSMTTSDKRSFTQLANVSGHHKGVTLIYLFQVLPSTGANKSMLGNLVNNAHYLVQITRVGINANDLTNMFRMTYGNSKELLQSVRDKCGGGAPPQFIVYDKQAIYFPQEINGSFAVDVSGRNGTSTNKGNNGKHEKGRNTESTDFFSAIRKPDEDAKPARNRPAWWPEGAP